MIKLNVDHIYPFYKHDWRIRELITSKEVHGAISVNPDKWGGYRLPDGTSWYVFKNCYEQPNTDTTHKYRLVFHDLDDGYNQRRFKDDQELYQFFDLYKYRDLEVDDELEGWY